MQACTIGLPTDARQLSSAASWVRAKADEADANNRAVAKAHLKVVLIGVEKVTGANGRGKTGLKDKNHLMKR
jgi:hypothetical protein